MESQIGIDFRALEALRLGAVSLREREDREAAEYQSDRKTDRRARLDDEPLPTEVVTGHSARRAHVEQ